MTAGYVNAKLCNGTVDALVEIDEFIPQDDALKMVRDKTLIFLARDLARMDDEDTKKTRYYAVIPLSLSYSNPDAPTKGFSLAEITVH